MDNLLNFMSSIRHKPVELQKQKAVLLAYIINDKAYLEKKASKICFNCNGMGHLAFECPEEPSAQARAAFLNRPENAEAKRRQRERKDRNYTRNLQKRNALGNETQRSHS